MIHALKPIDNVSIFKQISIKLCLENIIVSYHPSFIQHHIFQVTKVSTWEIRLQHFYEIVYSILPQESDSNYR